MIGRPVVHSGEPQCPRHLTLRFSYSDPNLAGRHGKGATLFARGHCGAIYGQGIGRQGNAYAIPTKDEQLRVLPLDAIEAFVAGFLEYARRHPDTAFELTSIGCGLAGYRPEQIAPMFAEAPDNVELPATFLAVLNEGRRAS